MNKSAAEFAILRMMLPHMTMTSSCSTSVAYNHVFIASANLILVFLAPYSCATIDLPVNWKKPEDGSIGVFVRRFSPPAPTKRVFIVPGGPGQALTSMQLLMMLIPIVTGNKGHAVYTIDHRGAGKSHPLLCSVPFEQNAKRCWGEIKKTTPQFKQFSVYNAAMDTISIMTRLEGSAATENAVYGVSYGVYLTQKILKLAPASARISNVIFQNGRGDMGYDQLNVRKSGEAEIIDLMLDKCKAERKEACPFVYSSFSELDAAIEANQNNRCITKLTKNMGMKSNHASMLYLLSLSAMSPSGLAYQIMMVQRAIKCRFVDGRKSVKVISPVKVGKMFSVPLFYLVIASELSQQQEKRPLSSLMSSMHISTDIIRQMHEDNLGYKVDEIETLPDVMAPYADSEPAESKTKCLFMSGAYDIFRWSDTKATFDSARCESKKVFHRDGSGHGSSWDAASINVFNMFLDGNMAANVKVQRSRIISGDYGDEKFMEKAQYDDIDPAHFAKDPTPWKFKMYDNAADKVRKLFPRKG
jgi:pimeloyl-ACP methyl ester carboxylesterase